MLPRGYAATTLKLRKKQFLFNLLDYDNSNTQLQTGLVDVYGFYLATEKNATAMILKIWQVFKSKRVCQKFRKHI